MRRKKKKKKKNLEVQLIDRNGCGGGGGGRKVPLRICIFPCSQSARHPQNTKVSPSRENEEKVEGK